MCYIYIKIAKQFDTLALWNRISYLKVNLTYTGETTWVYGEIASIDIGKLINYCLPYGPLDIEISRQGG